MANELMLSQGKLVQLDQKYSELAHSARTDKTYLSDYQAAFHAPAAFLQNPSNFEATFDKIIFHLDAAFKKTGNEDEKTLISRVAEELFNDHIYIIQARIEQLKVENNKGFLEKLFENLKNIGNKVSSLVGLSKGAAVAQISSEAIDLFKAYFDFLATKWHLEREESFFYNQLASVYAKILDSACFSNEFGLLRNTFSRNKEDILRFTTLQKGLTAALNLTKYDRTQTELMDSARAISRTLIARGDFQSVVDFLKMVKEKQLPNFIELKREAIESYRSMTVPQPVEMTRKKSKAFGISMVIFFVVFTLVSGGDGKPNKEQESIIMLVWFGSMFGIYFLLKYLEKMKNNKMKLQHEASVNALAEAIG